MTMDFIKTLEKKPILESLSFEAALMARLDHAVEKITESNNSKDHITMDIPLLIRVFELVREGAKTDVDVHNITERLLSIKDRGILSMKDYAEIAGPITKGEVPDKDMDEADDIENGYPMMASEDIKDLRSLAGIK